MSPKNPPHIPSILVRCIQEIESRGFNEQGLYRVNGSGIYICFTHGSTGARTPNEFNAAESSNRAHQIRSENYAAPPKIFRLDPRLMCLNLPFFGL